MNLRPIVAASVVALAVVACGPREPDAVSAAWGLTVAKATQITEFDPIGADERGASNIQLIEGLVLGGEGASGVVLYQPTAVVASPDGRMFVIDRGSNEVKMFDPNGSYLGAFGGEGQGPGQFTFLAQLAIAGNTVVTYGNRRLSTWTLAGELLGEHVLGARVEIELLRGFGDGTVIARVSEVSAETRERSTRIVRITSQGESRASYYEASSPRRAARVDGNPITNVQRSLDSLLTSTRTRYAVGAQGTVYLANLNAYFVVAMDPDGAELWAIRVRWPGLAWTDAAKQRLLGTLAAGLPVGAVSTDDLTWPNRNRALFGIATDGAGRLYVFPEEAVPTDPEKAPRARLVDVYSPTGEFVTSGTIPALWSSSQGEFVYGFRTNDADETEVVRYRLLIAGR